MRLGSRRQHDSAAVVTGGQVQFLIQSRLRARVAFAAGDHEVETTGVGTAQRDGYIADGTCRYVAGGWQRRGLIETDLNDVIRRGRHCRHLAADR
jgi:hypothetical protein